MIMHTINNLTTDSIRILTKRNSFNKFIISSQTLSEKTKELDKLQSEWTSKTSSLSNRHSQELQSEREKATEVGPFVSTGQCL